MVFGGYTYLIGIRLIGSVIGENIRTYLSPLDSYRLESQAAGSPLHRLYATRRQRSCGGGDGGGGQ